MAIIKSFTSLEQSKKLAKILPIESADMCYYEYTSHIDGTPKVGYKEGITNGTPCWSFAALLDVLPEGTRLLKSTNISSVSDTKYYCDCPKSNIGKWFDNPVDACYELILKLNELKML